MNNAVCSATEQLRWTCRDTEADKLTSAAYRIGKVLNNTMTEELGEVFLPAGRIAFLLDPLYRYCNEEMYRNERQAHSGAKHRRRGELCEHSQILHRRDVTSTRSDRRHNPSAACLKEAQAEQASSE